MTSLLSERWEGDIFIPPEGFGLVFMGGAAKGAYHLGVWQALRELDIPIRAVTGASIGSINGALVAQGDFDRAIETWHSIRMDQIVRAEGISEATDNLLDPKNLLTIAKEIASITLIITRIFLRIRISITAVTTSIRKRK